MTDSRLRSGHQPLDEVLGGGLPANGISIIMGLPGTGKTIVAQAVSLLLGALLASLARAHQQYTFRNARPDRPAVYFSTLSEPLEKILRFGQTLGFFDTSAVGTSVFYEDLGLVAGRDGLAGVGDHVAAVLKQRRPGLVVIDSFKALRVLADGDAEFRQFLHQLAGRLTAFPAASLWVGEYETDEVALSPEFAVAGTATGSPRKGCICSPGSPTSRQPAATCSAISGYRPAFRAWIRCWAAGCGQVPARWSRARPARARPSWGCISSASRRSRF